MIKIRIYLNNVTETVELIDNQKKLFQKGDVKMVFDSWTITDHEHRWGMKPGSYFWKGMVHKYLHKLPLEASFNSELVQDTAYIYAKLKTFFNSYKIEAKTFFKEEEIKREVEKEIEEEIKKEKGK